MADDNAISLDVDAKENYIERVAHEIARDKAKTENRLAMVLVWALVLSLPTYFIAVSIRPANGTLLADAMDKWFTVLGPLAGAAVGVGYLRQSQNSDRSRSHGR